ncbi:MAG TPA: dodecin family protein [Acidimicrobiia bacterium]|jgi:hypothetical protein
MSEFIESGAVKVIEVIGISTASFDDAMKAAVAKAAESISGITGVEVIKMNARVSDGVVTQYRVNCKIAFTVR